MYAVSSFKRIWGSDIYGQNFPQSAWARESTFKLGLDTCDMHVCFSYTVLREGRHAEREYFISRYQWTSKAGPMMEGKAVHKVQWARAHL